MKSYGIPEAYKNLQTESLSSLGIRVLYTISTDLEMDLYSTLQVTEDHYNSFDFVPTLQLDCSPSLDQ